MCGGCQASAPKLPQATAGSDSRLPREVGSPWCDAATRPRTTAPLGVEGSTSGRPACAAEVGTRSRGRRLGRDPESRRPATPGCPRPSPGSFARLAAALAGGRGHQLQGRSARASGCPQSEGTWDSPRLPGGSLGHLTGHAGLSWQIPKRRPRLRWTCPLVCLVFSVTLR